VSSERKQSTQEAGLQERQQGLAGYERIRATMPKSLGKRRMVETLSHLRGIGRMSTEMFSPSLCEYFLHSHTRLTQLHIESSTVTRTGTRQPTRCGREPNAVGQSVMTLPGNPLLSAACDKFHTSGWLVRAATDRSGGRTAVVVRDGNTVHMAKGCRLGGLMDQTRGGEATLEVLQTEGITGC
jgi:hypothetical protein